ncbi:DUF4817 domain-containing protein [Trichonephila clavipes]|nr:DUF4817 domain-containing protein [Trichonephila clavipes]
MYSGLEVERPGLRESFLICGLEGARGVVTVTATETSDEDKSSFGKQLGGHKHIFQPGCSCVVLGGCLQSFANTNRFRLAEEIRACVLKQGGELRRRFFEGWEEKGGRKGKEEDPRKCRDPIRCQLHSWELWFQQDGATCHTARATIDLLKDTFGDRLISRFGPANWPPRSCDLTPLDYFLWGYVRSLVYADKPQTLDHLEDNIRRVIADIRPQSWKKSSKIGRPDWTTSEPARPRGERLNPAFALKRHTAPEIGVMPHVLPLNKWLPGAKFQQDIVWPYTSRVSQDGLRTVTTLPWPARFPDLSLIEHIWYHLDGELGIPRV